MKTLPRVLLCWFLFSQLPAQEMLRFAGENGREIEAVGVLEATPVGLVMQMEPDSETILVEWEKFDRTHLREHHPEIYYARLDTLRYKTSILLRLGSFANLLSFEESLLLIRDALERDRYYTLPDNVNYLLEEDPMLQRWKNRDLQRYAREIESQRDDLEEFLRTIFPLEGIIIDDRGNLHHKERHDAAFQDKGQTSLRHILEVLGNTRQNLPRRGLDYLREISLMNEDFAQDIVSLNTRIPNPAFNRGNIDHIRLPSLLEQCSEAVTEILAGGTQQRRHQYKIDEFYNFLYGTLERYQWQASAIEARQPATTSENE